MTLHLAAELYERAAAITPPKIASKLTGLVGDGYWIDDRHYFFCQVAALVEGMTGFMPRIVDATTGVVRAVLELEAITAILSGHSEAKIAPADLAAAQYDMPAAGELVITLRPNAYHIALEGPTLLKVEALDPVPALHSPDGRHACFLKEHAVWLKDRANGTAEQLTPDGERYAAYGTVPESGVAPVSGRKFPIPVGLWSAGSDWFVTHRIDERHLPESGLVENTPAGGKRAIPHVFKVSSLSADLPKAEFVAYHPASGRSVSSAERPVGVHVMSPFTLRQCWFTGDRFFFLDWGRYSSEVALVEMNLTTSALRTVLSETADSGWIDVHPLINGQPIVRPLPASGEVIWYSQRDGSGRLYLHDLADGALKSRITQGDWVVRDIVHVDEAKRRILFLASGFEGDGDLGYRRLCAVDFDGGGFQTVLALEGDLAAKADPVSGVDQLNPYRPSYAPSGASPDGRYVVASIGAVDQATRFVLIGTQTGRVAELSRIDIDSRWTAPRPEPFKVLAADGVTPLFGALYFPTNFDPKDSYPLVDYVYPGPQANWFMRRFPNWIALSLQSVVEIGMVGIVLETRGMPNRNRAFHQAGNGHLLEPQLSDHVAAIEQLCQRNAFLDRKRVGMFGMSGGGAATARALFDYPEMFKVGVSVCGNHDNRNYIAHWMDKYGGRPGTVERDSQSNVEAAHKLQGKLLLMHGDMDDNVHPGHTLAVSAALIAAGKDFEQLILPGATHAVMMESPYAVQKLWSFFARHLLGVEPRDDFILRWTPAEAAAGILMMADNT
ncbi:MAG: prolyl oligopeptidase family serine peptidase [Caulobacteraceae bacterium]